MKYCPMCRREYADSDLSCPEHGPLNAAEPQSSVECDLCGKTVERGQKACGNCGASVNTQGRAAESIIERPSRTKPEKEIPRPPRYGSADRDALRAEERPFHFSDLRPDRSKARSTGVVLTAAGFIVCIAVGLILIRERYSTKPAVVTSVKEQTLPAPRPENPLPLELPAAETQSLADKPGETFTAKTQETEALTEKALKRGNGGSAAKATQRPAVRPDGNSEEKRQGSERSAPVSLKIPSGVRIPSPVELRRKRAQLESEQATAKHAIPDGVAIPSPLEIRRKRIEYEIDQAIQNRAIQGVTVAFIGTTAYLTGQVETERQRAAAEQAARAVPDVGSIRSSISVRDTKG